MGGGIGILGERSKGIRKYKLVVTKESQRYEVEHRARSQEIAITMCGARWVLEIPEQTLVTYVIV